MTTSSSASMCSCAMYTLANGNMCNTATQRWINRRFSVSCLFFLSFWCFLWVFVVENCENRISIWRQTILLCARVAVGLLSRQLTYADDEYTHTHTIQRHGEPSTPAAHGSWSGPFVNALFKDLRNLRQLLDFPFLTRSSYSVHVGVDSGQSL